MHILKQRISSPFVGFVHMNLKLLDHLHMFVFVIFTLFLSPAPNQMIFYRWETMAPPLNLAGSLSQKTR